MSDRVTATAEHPGSAPRVITPDGARWWILLVALPLTVGVVYSLRRWVLQPMGIVNGTIGFFEVVVWAFFVATSVAQALVWKKQVASIGPPALCIVLLMAVVDIVRTRVLEPYRLVTQHIGLSETLTWTLIVGSLMAIGLSVTTRSWIRSAVEWVRLQPRRRFTFYAVLWIVVVVALTLLGAAVRQLEAMLALVGVINGCVGVAIVAPFIEQPFSQALMGFLYGVSVDTLSADRTVATRTINAVANVIQQVATAVASAFGSSVDLHDGFVVSLWTTLAVVLVTLLLLSASRRSAAPMIAS